MVLALRGEIERLKGEVAQRDVVIAELKRDNSEKAVLVDEAR